MDRGPSGAGKTFGSIRCRAAPKGRTRPGHLRVARRRTARVERGRDTFGWPGGERLRAERGPVPFGSPETERLDRAVRPVPGFGSGRRFVRVRRGTAQAGRRWTKRGALS